jgi:hypothetical protein
MVRISKRGRKHGLGLVGISQRPASVDKEFITQCNWLVWHRLSWDNDVAVVRRVLGSAFASEIADLADGEAYLALDPDVLAEVAGTLGRVSRVQFTRKETYDAGEAPGLDDERRPELKGIDDDLVEELQSISDRTQRRRDELDRLRERLDDRATEVEALEAELADTKDIRGIMGDMVGSLADQAEAGGEGSPSLAGSGSESGSGSPEEVTVTVEGTELDVPEVIRTEVMEIRERKRAAETRAEAFEEAHERHRRAAEHLAGCSASARQRRTSRRCGSASRSSAS